MTNDNEVAALRERVAALEAAVEVLKLALKPTTVQVYPATPAPTLPNWPIAPEPYPHPGYPQVWCGPGDGSRVTASDGTGGNGQ